MNTEENPVRAEIAIRLSDSRERLRDMLAPEHERPEATESHADGRFPRSRTMRILTSGRTIAVVVAVAGAIMVTRPGVAARLARMIPVAGIARLLFTRFLANAATDRGDHS